MSDWRKWLVDRGLSTWHADFVNEHIRLMTEDGNEADRRRAENAALAVDAERYRVLRAMNWCDSPLCVVANPKSALKLGYDCPSLERLDAAIDAARGKT